MKLSKLLFFNPKHLTTIAVILSVIFLIIDSVIEVVFFGEEKSIIESLISPEPAKLWMRFLVIFLFIAFSYFLKYLLNLQINATNELREFKNKLKKLIGERTNELKVKNAFLENEIKIRKKTEEKLEALAVTDPLTLLYNRRKFNEVLSHEISRERRYKTGLSIIMSDFDNFKPINDKFGHETGDKVLKQFSQTIKSSLRDSDLLARWGGDEFVILVPNTNPDMARSIAKKIRKLIEKTEFEVANKITASFGVASLNGDDNEETFIKRADRALYKAKEKGRNLVVIAKD